MSEGESLTAMLHLATDRIDDPHLERETWALGRRRRMRRRGLAACALAASLTAGVIVAVHATGGESAGLAPATHTPSPSAGPHVWPAWDPHDVDSLPRAPDDVVPALPDRIRPPAGAPLLAHDPVAAAVAVTVIDGRVQVLGTDGAWRTVAVSGVGPNVTALLSPAGTRLVVKPDGPDVVGTTVVDLATGRSRPLTAPPGFRAVDASWTFVDERTLLLRSGRRGWLVDARTGTSGAAPQAIARYGSATAVDPDGGVLVSAEWGNPRVLTDWDGTSTREVTMDRTGRFSSLQADEDTVAGTSYDRGPLRVVVADRATLTPTTVLPIKPDPEGIYGKGLSALAVSDDGWVLFWVVTMAEPGQQGGIRVVAWDPATDRRFLVSGTASAYQVDFAVGLLRDNGS